MAINYPPTEHLTHVMLEDLGFNRVGKDDLEWTRIELAAIGYKIVDWGNGSWHFAPLFSGISGLGKMKCLDDLIRGFEFATGQKLIK